MHIKKPHLGVNKQSDTFTRKLSLDY